MFDRRFNRHIGQCRLVEEIYGDVTLPDGTVLEWRRHVNDDGEPVPEGTDRDEKKMTRLHLYECSVDRAAFVRELVVEEKGAQGLVAGCDDRDAGSDDRVRLVHEESDYQEAIEEGAVPGPLPELQGYAKYYLVSLRGYAQMEVVHLAIRPGNAAAVWLSARDLGPRTTEDLRYERTSDKW